MIGSPDGCCREVREETPHFFFVEISIRAQPAANIQAERLHLCDGFGDVFGIQSAGEINWNGYRFDNLPADAPVVFSTRAAEFLHREFLIARVEQDGIDLRRDRCGFVHRFRAGNVDDLNKRNTRQCSS